MNEPSFQGSTGFVLTTDVGNICGGGDVERRFNVMDGLYDLSSKRSNNPEVQQTDEPGTAPLSRESLLGRRVKQHGSSLKSQQQDSSGWTASPNGGNRKVGLFCT